MRGSVAPIKFFCWDGLPNFCAGHAAYVVRRRGNNVLEVAPALRFLNSRFDVSPSGAFLIALASVLAILNVICSYIETAVIAPQSVFVVLPLGHPDYRRRRFRPNYLRRFPLRPKKTKTDKKRPTIPALTLPVVVTLETFISLISKPPPRMATANKIAPK
jgi:hypothetical protein